MRLYHWVFFLSLLGILLSGYSLYTHYAPSSSTICNWSETFSCDLVNKSQYSEIIGIPVALVGLGGYVLLAFLSWLCLKGKNFKKDLVIFSTLGFLFSLYLTYIEAFVLRVWCPLCLASQVVIVVILVLSVVGLYKASHKFQITNSK